MRTGRTAANRTDVASRLSVRTTAACRLFPSGETLHSTASAGSCLPLFGRFPRCRVEGGELIRPLGHARKTLMSLHKFYQSVAWEYLKRIITAIPRSALTLSWIAA